MQARLIRSVRQNKKDERSAINVVFCPFGYFSTTMCPKLRKCTRYRMVALARDRAKVKKGGYRRKSGSLRSKKVDTVRKAEVIGSVHDDVCTHRSRATCTVQNRLA